MGSYITDTVLSFRCSYLPLMAIQEIIYHRHFWSVMFKTINDLSHIVRHSRRTYAVADKHSFFVLMFHHSNFRVFLICKFYQVDSRPRCLPTLLANEHCVPESHHPLSLPSGLCRKGVLVVVSQKNVVYSKNVRWCIAKTSLFVHAGARNCKSIIF